MVEGKTVTTIYKLKGTTKHTETFTLGNTTKVTALSGKERNVTASVEGEVVILKSDAPNYVTKVEKCGTQLCMVSQGRRSGRGQEGGGQEGHKTEEGSEAFQYIQIT